MKTIPPPCPEPEVGPKYWRSLDQLADKPEFRQWVEREFPAGASELTDPVNRRHFVKIMSASFLFAGLGLTGCRRPEEHILPFAKMPENYVHGVPQYYATARPVRGTAIPLVVKSSDGRPTKLEGNSLHPDSNGATDHFTQASILDLYDPDRAMRYATRGSAANREVTGVAKAKATDFLATLSKEALSGGGEGLAILSERTNSPSRNRVQKLISDKFPKARWFIYEPVDFEICRQAASLAFGKAVTPYFKFDAAKAILSLDSDFLGLEENAHLSIRQFAKSRRVTGPEDQMSRLYVVEGLYSLTGANADHRLRVPSSSVLGVAASIAIEVAKQTGKTDLVSALTPIAASAKVDPKWIIECAKDLVASGNGALVVAGYRQPLAVHLIAHAINSALGSVGTTVTLQDYTAPGAGSIAELAQLLNAGSVKTLVISGGNPIYNAPADLDWAKAQQKAKTILRLGYYEDETTHAGVDWHFPLTHYLESWGDARTADGTLVPVQPLIAPLFDGITELELLARLGGLPETSPYEIVRETFRSLGGSDEDAWRKFLHDGFLANSHASTVAVNFDASAVAQTLAQTKPLPAATESNLEVIFYRSYSTDDGRFNNNGWLQETPEPLTRITWDNAVLMSQATAAALKVGNYSADDKGYKADAGLFDNEVVEIQLGGRKIEGAVWIQPGMADNVVAVALGYGRDQAGRIGRSQSGHPAGFNVYALRTTTAEHIALGAKVSSTGRTYPIASTQEHNAMEGRPIIREATLEQYRKHHDFVQEMDTEPPPSAPKDEFGHPKSLYPNPLDNEKVKASANHQWGMAIDLNTCVGCQACSLACQSENNIPIVGKDQVRRGREMSWIRLDRYFTGGALDPQVVFQPMLCQHCETAPCESVCPVNATAHTEEGLNSMAYNRCVGTRYCSNNCPYKVRRFNFLDFNRRPLESLVGPFYSTPMLHQTDGEWDMSRWWKNPDRSIRPDEEWELLKLVKNPDVTVRMRGVMEKCSFCIQRIEQAKIAQLVKAGASGNVVVPDGVIKTACQQACPAEAIVFGNLKDSQSEVSKLKAQTRNYSVLDFLLTKPRTTYLARLRNPNPAMPDSYKENPGSLEEYFQKHGNTFEEHGESHAEGHGTKAHSAEKGAH